MPTKATKRGANRLRVLTFNAYGPANPDWPRRHQVSGDAVRALDADVIALQEVPVDPDFLREYLGTDHHVSTFSAASEDGVAGALATRWPQTPLAELDLRISDRAREALPWTATSIVEVRTPLGPLVVAHHKPSWPFPYEQERLEQALLAARAVESRCAGRENVHAVVLGDFDATPDSASLQFWRGRRPHEGISVCYQDAWEYLHPDDPGRTFALSNPLVAQGEVATAVGRRIDYVLVRAGRHGPTLQVDRCELFLDRAVRGVWASDHFGVVADLSLPARRPGFRS